MEAKAARSGFGTGRSVSKRLCGFAFNPKAAPRPAPPGKTGTIRIRQKSAEEGERDKDSGHQRCHKRNHGDLRVDGRAGRILKRIAHRVAHHGSLVRLRSLAALMPRFDVFLRVVPQAAGVR